MLSVFTMMGLRKYALNTEIYTINEGEQHYDNKLVNF